MIAVAPHHSYIFTLSLGWDILSYGVGYCFIRTEAMREAHHEIRQYVPTPFLFINLSKGDRENNFLLMNSFLFKGILFFYILFLIVSLYAQQQNFIYWGSKKYIYTQLEYTIMNYNITSINWIIFIIIILWT